MKGGKSRDKYQMGQSVLEELIENNMSRPDAYIAQWSVEYKLNRNFDEALNIAE